jgi:cytidine deaminase
VTTIDIKLEPADELDRELLAAATDLLTRQGRPEFNSVAAVLKTGDGRRFAAMDVRSRKSPVCAEPAALAAAQAAGAWDVERIAAVCRIEQTGEYTLISPCGACRELLFFQVPDATILVSHQGEPHRVVVRDLFPFAAIGDLPARPGE